MSATNSPPPTTRTAAAITTMQRVFMSIITLIADLFGKAAKPSGRALSSVVSSPYRLGALIVGKFRKAAKPSTFHDQYAVARKEAGLPDANKTEAEGLTNVAFVFSSLMTVSSMAMNITFACMLAASLWGKVLFSCAYLASDIFKIAAPSLTRFFWIRGNPFFSAAITFGLIVAIGLSWISGTGFLAGESSNTEAGRLERSADYRNNQEQQQRMRDDVAAVAVAPEAVQAAQSEIARLKGEWEKAYAQRSQFFERDYTPKQVKNTADTWHNRTEKEVREVMKPIDDAIADQQAIIARAGTYQATFTG